jgi:hypothetical protein
MTSLSSCGIPSCGILLPSCRIRFHERVNSVMNYIKTIGPIWELKVPKVISDQCFSNGNTTEHLPPPSIMQDQLCHLYSGSRAFTGECGSRLALSRLHPLEEARAPVKTRRNSKKLITLSIVNSKLFYIFLPYRYLLCIVCTINIFKYRQKLPNLDNERSQFLMFNICIILVRPGMPHWQWWTLSL